MAQLAISSAVNIGVGLLINLLFPSRRPDVTQVGPRLGDLSVTSSAYGQFVSIHYGTVRTGGNVIWSPGIEEVANTNRQTAGGKGGGGGGSVTTTTFQYFASFALALGEGVGEDILRIWADGKLVYDKTGSSNVGSLKFRLYPGDEDQLPDPLIEADVGAGNAPAHRGLCYMVAERWPLANFGNRIPNVTVELTFRSQVTAPFAELALLPGQNVPGSATGSDQASHIYVDPFTDDAWLLKSGGLARASLGSMSTQVIDNSIGSLSSQAMRFCMDGFLWSQQGSDNFAGFLQYDPVTLEHTGLTLGGFGTIGSWGNPFNFPNPTHFGVLRVGDPNLGQSFVDIYVFSAFSTLGNGGFVVEYQDETGAFVQDNHLDTDIGDGGPVMQDHVGRRLFVTQDSPAQVDLWEVTAGINVGPLGVSAARPEKRLVGSYQKGGVDLSGTANSTGWCHLPSEGAIIISNGSSMFKADLDTGAVLARNLALGFSSQDQYSTSGVFAFGNGAQGASAGAVHTISTDDLAVVDTLDLGVPFPGAEANYPRGGYDERNHSLLFSRVNGTNPATNRVVRVLLGRRDGQAVPLSDVVADISDRVLVGGDLIDVSDLASDSVLGYSITRQGPARAALEPLMRGYLFEGAESDWKMKFVRRGKAPVLTVQEDHIGRVSGGEGEIIREVRTQEVELPERFSIQYSDKEKDYQQGTQSDKRISLPTPSQFARNEASLDLPIVFEPSAVKQLAQRWLYTSWAERLSLLSSLPWRYMRLDPTDVFSLEFRGETRRLRMAQMELGADLVTDFAATQEDADSDTSSVEGSGGIGHLPQSVPSSLPSKLLLLDLPLLLAADAGLQQFSRAYWAGAGYDANWPGALLYQSKDDGASFQELGSTGVEATWGNVVGAVPDALSTTGWDDVTTIDLRVAKGIANLSPSTDLEVLNGANALAVVRSDGLPEIVQFVDMTQLDASTVRISRLLRGRRGTEPLAVGHGASERWVLLQQPDVEAFQLPLSLVGVQAQYRLPTFGTLLEDAPANFFTYTGQDLTPYSVAHIASTRPGGNLAVTWVRRTRFNGELRDGTGTVPLNEQAELYEVEFFNPWSASPFLVRTGITSPSTTLTVAEYNAATGASFSSVPTVDVDIYQVSALVGRGRKASARLELAAAPFSDPHLASVVLLAGFNGYDGATSSADESASAHAITFNSPGSELDEGARQSGPSSLLLSGAVTARVNVSGSLVDFDLGTGPFTIELWMRADPGFQNDGILGRPGGGGSTRYVLFLNANGTVQFFGPATLPSGVTDVRSATRFAHVAISRVAGPQTRTFVNGTQEGATSTAVFDIAADAVNPFVIGDDTAFVNRELHGHVDEVRITKGVGRYSADFVPFYAPFPRT